MTVAEQSLLFVVEDRFALNQGRAVLATGRIERGRVHSGAMVEIVGSGVGGIVPVAGVETVERRLDEARAGMHVGLRLPGTCAVECGDVLATPGSIRAHPSFVAEIAVLAEDAGGSEVRTGDRLDFYIRAGGVRGVVGLTDGVAALQPVHQALVTVTLERAAALEVGHHFAFRHRGRAAGSGTVVELC